MNDFVQLWVYLASTPLFGLTATLAAYVSAQALYERLGRAPWANPVLWSVVAIGTVLVATHIPYPSYFAGAQFVHVLLGPAVVALAWPLWLRRAQMRRRGPAFGGRRRRTSCRTRWGLSHEKLCSEMRPRREDCPTLSLIRGPVALFRSKAALARWPLKAPGA